MNRSNEGLEQTKERGEHHNHSQIKRLFEQFLSEYDLIRQNEIWVRQSEIFKRFWTDKIIDHTHGLSLPDDTNPLIKMLDTGGGSHRVGVESVAKTNWHKPKYRWECLFEDLKNDKKIQQTIDQIFQETDDAALIGLIDCLAHENKKRNYLTAENGIAMNALLFINKPATFLKAVSLEHRFKIMRTFRLGNPDEFKTYGQKIVLSNRRIIDGFKEGFGIDTAPMALTEFLYTPRCWGRRYSTVIKSIWDPQPSSKSKNS